MLYIKRNVSLRVRDPSNPILYTELHRAGHIDYLVYTEVAGLAV